MFLVVGGGDVGGVVTVTAIAVAVFAHFAAFHTVVNAVAAESTATALLVWSTLLSLLTVEISCKEEV